MFNDKILKSVAEAVKSVVDEALKGDQHKIDKNKNGKVDAHDFKLLRKEEAKKPASPFDWKNTPRQTAEKGEKTGHTAKKISTGTVYTKKYTKEEASQEEFNKEIKKAQDKSTGKVKADVAKPAVQAVRVEESQQLDELKKSTLASYVKKASHDVAHKGALTRQFANDSAAAKKDSDYFGAKKADDKANKMFAKSWKRREGMGKAVDRLAKEEVEQIVEISTKTLARAASAASDPMKHYDDDEKYHDPQKFADHAKKTKDAKSAAAVQGAADGKGHYPRPGHSVGVYDKLAYRAPARVTASGKANKQDVKTLKKNIRSEEVEQIAELSVDTMKAAKKELTNRAYGAHMDDNKAGARDYAARALHVGDKIKKKEREMKKEEVEQIEERSLTTAEKAAMEKNVKGMKKNIAGFKERYGKDAKSVMYATATANAKKSD